MSERRISQLPDEIGRDLHPAERAELVDVWARLGEPSTTHMRDDSQAWEDLQRRIAQREGGPASLGSPLRRAAAASRRDRDRGKRVDRSLDCTARKHTFHGHFC